MTMEESDVDPNDRKQWSRRKKDAAPRGVFRHPSGVWAVRFTCGAGCWPPHKRKIGPLKTEAISAYYEMRGRANREPGWCPRIEAQRERGRVRAEQLRERARVTFGEYVAQYEEYAKVHKRSWRTDEGRIKLLRAQFGDTKLDEVTPLEIEQFRDSLLPKRSKATANRYRDLLSAIFKRAIRDGYVTSNPVKTVTKFRENNERVAHLSDQEGQAVLEALSPEHRPHFLISVNTGLRWSEQMNLRWRDVDLLSGFITVPRSKNGRARRVPMNSKVRAILLDLGTERQRPDDSAEPVFRVRPRESKAFFPKAVERARVALKSAGVDAPNLDTYVWHSNRHTFASKLVMAGVDPITVKELGGWRTLAMVNRYAHLAPGHLHAAVERLVAVAAEEVTPK
jgi:integrase